MLSLTLAISPMADHRKKTRRIRMRVPALHHRLALAALALCCLNAHAAERPFDWQQDYARVTEKIGRAHV